MTKLLVFIFICIHCQGLLALEFEHFSLKNELYELNRLKSGAKADQRTTRKSLISNNENAHDQTLAEKAQQVAQKVLGLDKSTKLDPSVSPLLVKIAQSLANNYNEIGKEQTSPMVLNQDIGGGVLNFSGFTWQKPFANFQLYVNRQLAPDLWSDRWIIHDQLVINIDASTLLTNMKNAQLIDITETAIGAFAGISFSREYKYSHFANSFIEGLQADYSKLFLSFAKFNPGHVLSMDPYVIMKLKDTFSFNAGGLVSVPAGGVLSGQAGVLVNTAYERGLVLQSLGPDDSKKEGEFLRLGVESSTEVSAGAHLSLQADFFNLLKISILAADFEYAYGSTNQTNLSFFQKDKELIINSPIHYSEFKNLVSARKDEVSKFKTNIVSLKESINQSLSSKYSILLLGSMKKRETEQVKVVKNGVEKVFFKHYAESVKFVQNLWSRIFGRIIYALFEWDTGVKNAAETKKKLAMEFEHMEDLGEGIVDGQDKFSLSLTQNFQAAKTHRWWHGLYRRESKKQLASMTNLDPKFVKMLNNRTLRGPLEITSNIKLNLPAFARFHAMTRDEVLHNLKEVCELSDSLSRSRRSSAAKRCYQLLKKKFLRYNEHRLKSGTFDLIKFKNFMGSFFKRIRTYQDLHLLFGKENVFMSGSFTATTNKGAPFATYFKEGSFQGLGVIDTFTRESVSEKINRAPASIPAK